jgi:predicted lipid carrier protein YhbT
MPFFSLLRIPVVMAPLPLAEALANLVYKKVLAGHPTLFDRLDAYRDRRFGFLPKDLPLCFVARPSDRRIEVYRKPLTVPLAVSVAAPFGMLLDLLEGKADGDALFFSRDIEVEGDMEALLALRNALDDARIDLVDDVVGARSPVAPLMRAMMRELAPDRQGEAGRWN